MKNIERSRWYNVLMVVAYVNMIIVMLGIMVIVTHGPEVVFQTEPAKAFGEWQRNPMFYVIFIVNFISAFVIIHWTEKLEEGEG